MRKQILTPQCPERSHFRPTVANVDKALFVMSCFVRLTMTDAEENLKVKSVTEFLLKSCRQRKTEQFSFVKAFRVLPAVHPVDGLKCTLLLMHTGSTAELYIKPMLSCVGDTDIMYHYSNEFAIPAGYPPPSQLPTDFESRVKVYEIVDSHLSGYVYLTPTYILTRNTHDSAYIIAEYISRSNSALNHELYLNVDDQTKIHGPAYMYRPWPRNLHSDFRPKKFITQMSGVTTDSFMYSLFRVATTSL